MEISWDALIFLRETYGTCGKHMALCRNPTGSIENQKTSYGNPLESYGNPVDILWNLCGILCESYRHVNHMGCCGNPMVILKESYESPWKSFGNLRNSYGNQRKSYGRHVEIPWKPYRNPMNILWKIHGHLKGIP
jgi:hypothetical protein